MQDLIIQEISDYRSMVKSANCGAGLTDKQSGSILTWANDSKTLKAVQNLKDNGNVIEGPDKDEPLIVADSLGNLSLLNNGAGKCFPRWTCHLLGIRHRCAHAVVTTPNGFIITQKRSSKKDVSPGAWDIAVGGHVKGGGTFEEALLQEMYEEIGIRKQDTLDILEFGIYESNTTYPEKNFCSIEVRKVFEVILSKGSFDKIRFTDNEVAGIYLCDKENARHLIEENNIASGIKHTLPRYLEWKCTNR